MRPGSQKSDAGSTWFKNSWTRCGVKSVPRVLMAVDKWGGHDLMLEGSRLQPGVLFGRGSQLTFEPIHEMIE